LVILHLYCEGRLHWLRSHGLANFLSFVAMSVLLQQFLLKSLCYVCWYAIDNNKREATGVILNCSGFLEYKKFISWDQEKNIESWVS